MHFFFITSIALLAIISLGRKTNDWFSPYIFIIFDFFARVALYFLIFNDESVAALDSSLIISIYLYIFTLWILFFFFNNLFSKFPSVQGHPATRPNRLITIITLTISASVIAFVLIFVFGSYSVTAWLSDPRQGYQFGRKGVGIFYAMYWFFVTIAFIYLIYYWKYFGPMVRYFLVSAIVILCYLLASKRALIALFLFALLYYHYFIRRFNLLQLFFSGLSFAAFFVGYFWLLSGSFTGLLEYFTYVSNSSVIFEALHSGDLSYGYGAINLTRLWEFIPRILYPEKPFIFGGAYVTEYISPGKAEEGHSLGMLDFTIYFFDFWFLGVILFALFVTSYTAFIYNIFLRNRNSFIYFVLLCSIYSPIFNFGPNILFLIILSIYMFIFIKLRFK